MNGILLTIYLFFGWQSEWYRTLNLLAGENSPLWPTLFGFERHADVGVFHLASTLLIAVM